MGSKLVSVIIPTHNREASIVLRAVNSVLNQTYKDIELIVVDDSTDEYPEKKEVEIAVHAASSTIQYIKNDNKGASAARNTGLQNAKGSYVAFLDDDDEWLPMKIEKQIKGFIDNSIALVYCWTRIYDDLGNVYIKSNKKSGNYLDAILEGNFIGGSSNPLIKKTCIFEVGGFDIDMQASQDYDLWIRLAKRYSINYIDEVLLNYNAHSNERISNNIDKRIAGEERIQAKYEGLLQKNKRALYQRRNALMKLYLLKGCHKKALSIWFQLLKTSPTKVKENTKKFVQILFDYNSVLYRFFLRVQKSHKRS